MVTPHPEVKMKCMQPAQDTITRVTGDRSIALMLGVDRITPVIRTGN